jgi:DNA-binding Xre family transcriptional regulator
MKYLKKIMEAATMRNIPLKKLADLIGITEMGLKTALKNDTLRINQLNIICGELGIEVGDLFIIKNPIKKKTQNNFHFLNNKTFC